MDEEIKKAMLYIAAIKGEMEDMEYRLSVTLDILRD